MLSIQKNRHKVTTRKAIHKDDICKNMNEILIENGSELLNPQIYKLSPRKHEISS